MSKEHKIVCSLFITRVLGRKMNTKKYKWLFRAGLRKGAMGWRSSRLAVEKVKNAVSEIKNVARRDPVLGGEGAVLFLEVVSPALENVDGSSGALGTAVNNAVAELVPVLVDAPVDDVTREAWVGRLWRAFWDDEIPYLERLGEHWGELCGTPGRASDWADRLLPPLKEVWGRGRRKGDYFKGISACLSCLLASGRYEELLKLLDYAPFVFWADRKYGVHALLALGRKAEALKFAEASRGLNDRPEQIARMCEEILLSSGLVEEAYARYALLANAGVSCLATFRAISKKYPHKQPNEILEDLVARSSGDEGKWFATAKTLGLFDEAIRLANASPCDPRTLTRAARDHAQKNPSFALEVGLTALKWLAQGHGYKITTTDVTNACKHTLDAAKNAGKEKEAQERIRKIVVKGPPGNVVAMVLRLELE